MAREYKRVQPSQSKSAPVEEEQLEATSVDLELDDLLDEIDDVLETNAEEFVHSFVQKGGQ